MVDDSIGRGIPTRREFIQGGSGLVAGGMLAGCTSTGGSQESGDGTDGSYTVSMAPMGETEFDAVPESIFTRLTHLAGMAFALGRGNDVNAMHAPDYYDQLWNQYTPHLDGVSLDWSGLYSSWDPDKEKLYDLNSDVHLADPASVFALQSWNMEDIEEIGSDVGPWFGNQFSDSHGTPPEEWVDDYEYYGLWEMFERVAAVFQEEARYEALAGIHDDLLNTLESVLPPESERPTAVLIGASDLDSIYAYPLDDPGFLTAHVSPLEPVSAFSDEVGSTTQIGMEALLEANPDVIFALGGMHPQTSIGAIRSGLADDAAGSQLPAVQNDRVYAQGARYQGPILNLFQLEMTAKQLYPDAFGEWPTYTEGPYPEIPEEEQLFDRDRVAAVIRGEFDQ
ncbi:ABC transporter substrate-binding protein [Halostella litorea]|uniref:ABC transporter substrate-binding protein n=1 Tax=Halostella litorea TaxID=2528831 RepID=UPI001092BED7|nr:ABC transporter substrate-binding protein [Halostella litorea]